jgi:hypothetical protein
VSGAEFFLYNIIIFYFLMVFGENVLLLVDILFLFILYLCLFMISQKIENKN